MKAIKKVNTKYYKYNYSSWTQPVLSSNGSIGVSDLAILENVRNESNAYATFNGTSNYIASNWANIDFVIYSNNAINVTSISLKNGGMYATYGGIFYTSDDGVNWTQIGTFTQALSDSSYTSFSVNTSGYHNYYRILLNAANTYSNGNRHVSCGGIKLTATQRIITESSSGDYDFAKDMTTFRMIKGNNKYYAVL